MAKSPLFSTYRQGENRVTSSMLAVFERIDLSLLEQLLGAASGETALQMVSFANQPGGAGASVPDARISGQFTYWFEVKTDRDAVREVQLREHLANLDGSGGDEQLFVVTPDATPPGAITELQDHGVVWFSFSALSDAIDAALDDQSSIVSEYTQFLLRELQALLKEDGLLDTDDVVVVAARVAYPEYLQYAAYVCQPGRSFREGLTHMGFYADGEIKPEVPRITYREDDVLFTRGEAQRRQQGGERDQRIAELIVDLLDIGPRQEGESFQVFLLGRPGDDSTVMLPKAVPNDTRAASGRTWAWTLGQRYVSLTRLTAPDVAATSDLQPAT